MADKQKSSRSSTARTRVVTAEGDASNKKPSKTKSTVTKADTKAKETDTKKVKKVSNKPTAKRTNPFAAFWGYLKGAWFELRQVRWPNRKETWGMTFAVILFTAFFVVLVLLLDAGYQYLFDVILGR